MTTSGITSWPLTVGEIITQAAYELGAYAAGETLSGEDMEDGMLRLNGMLNYWGGEGNLYREETTQVAFLSGVGEEALDQNIKSVSAAWAQTASYNRKLVQFNRSQYLAIPRPGQEGQPSIYYVETGRDGLTLHLWPVPSTDTTIALDYIRRTQTVTDINETLDVPQDWQEAVIFGLATRMANMFGKTRTDPGTVGRIDQRANASYQRLLDRDRPDSYILEPDF